MNWEASNLPLCKQETPNSYISYMHVHCTVYSNILKYSEFSVRILYNAKRTDVYEMFRLTHWIGVESRLNRHICNNINEITSEKAWTKFFLPLWDESRKLNWKISLVIWYLSINWYLFSSSLLWAFWLSCIFVVLLPLKGLSHEIDFKNFDKKLHNLA